MAILPDTRPWAEIDLGRIAHNVRFLQSRAGPTVELMHVIKGNAYGHGLIPIARYLVRLGTRRLAVGRVEEALHLREAGIRASLLVLGRCAPAEARQAIRRSIELSLHSLGEIRCVTEEARRAGRQATVHLKVDTGMHRLGCPPDELPAILEAARLSSELAVRGIFTHISWSSPDTKSRARRQVRAFLSLLEGLRSRGVRVPSAHACASAGLLSKLVGPTDMARPGLAVYGIAPWPEGCRFLRPALTLKARVLHLKRAAAGSSVGYEGTYVPREDTRLAVLGIGYADGYPISLSNRARVLLRGRPARVVGRISMDYTIVDVGSRPDVRVGDEAILIGSSGDESIGVWDLARLTGSVPHEVLSSLSARVLRMYKTEANISSDLDLVRERKEIAREIKMQVLTRPWIGR